jgi:hypothetical protein
MSVAKLLLEATKIAFEASEIFATWGYFLEVAINKGDKITQEDVDKLKADLRVKLDSVSERIKALPVTPPTDNPNPVG